MQTQSIGKERCDTRTVLREQRQQSLYFQKQGCLSRMCGLHVLNNFFGNEQFRKQDLDQISEQLYDTAGVSDCGCCNPFKSCLGGYYSGDVLGVALQRAGFEMCFQKQRVPIQTGNQLGYIINTQYQGVCRCLLQFLGCGGHWFLIKKVDEQYYLFDSVKKQPRLLQGSIKGYLEQYRQQEAFIWKISKQQMAPMTEMIEINSHRKNNADN